MEAYNLAHAHGNDHSRSSRLRTKYSFASPDSLPGTRSLLLKWTADIKHHLPYLHTTVLPLAMSILGTFLFSPPILASYFPVLEKSCTLLVVKELSV